MLSACEFTNHLSRPEPSIPRVLTILSFVIEKLVARNNGLVDDLTQPLDALSCGSAAIGKRLNPFHGVRAPSISIPKYLERLYKYTDCSPSCFVVAYVYIDRLVHKHPDSLVLSLNVHRLLVTSVMVASKMLDDVHYNNAFYAKVGGVSNAELNRLEVEFLFLLDFGVTVSSRIFESYCFHLEKEMMLNGACQTIERALVPITDVADVPGITENTQSSSSVPHNHEYFPKNLMSTLSEFWYWRLLAVRRLPAFIYQQLGFLAYAWKLWNKGKGLQLVDHEVLDDSYFLLEVMKYVHIELLYVQNNATDRPTMHDGYSVDAK